MITMRPEQNICGEVAIANATGLTLAEVDQKGWLGKFWGNDDDSIYHHEVALQRLGYGMQQIDKEEVLNAEFVPGKTLLCMLADDKNPISYHWFVLCEPTSKGVAVMDGISENKISVKWARIASGWGKLACAYIITDVAPKSVSWYKRAWVWLTGMMKFKLWG